MCGIVGYVGRNNPTSILLEGLRKLEYRGYDSSGIALKNGNQLQVIKSVGKIVDLENKINSIDIINSGIGIAHTRWATHGKVDEKNAHPHTNGKITIVHNGIIENAFELKDKMKEEGIIFKSDTDSEVIAALINKYYEDDIILAINLAIKELKGSYALAVLVLDDDKIFAVRKDSPLVIGSSKDGYFIASDVFAISDYADKYFLLDEGEVACLSFSDSLVFKNGEIITKQSIKVSASGYDYDKCGYDHYMLKEIMEQPVVLEKMLSKYLDDINELPDLKGYDSVHIVACGSAMYAGMIGKCLLEEYGDFNVYCEVASEYRYKHIIYNPKTLVIVISQSGETADTIAALRKAKENKIDTLAIVNVVDSTIARESDRQVFIEAGIEIAVATTKAYLLQVAILALLSYKQALDNNKVNKEILEEFRNVSGLLREVLDKKDKCLEIAKDICREDNIFFIGRKIDYAMCLEGSLKLKEISYIHSEAYQAGELKHGTISLINNDSKVISIITDDSIRDKSISNVEEVKSRGATIISISNFKNYVSDLEILVPKLSDFTQCLLVVPYLQLIAYYVALIRDCDIDKPKNLAKSVTVE